jgi:hypothetical protein
MSDLQRAIECYDEAIKAEMASESPSIIFIEGVHALKNRAILRLNEKKKGV